MEKEFPAGKFKLILRGTIHGDTEVKATSHQPGLV